MAIERSSTPYGEAAYAALRAALHQLQAGDRLAPVTVLVHSNAVGVAARRWLSGQRRRRRGTVPHHLPPRRAARRAGARRGRAAAAVDPDHRRRRARGAAHRAGVFAPIARHQATITAAARRPPRAAPPARPSRRAHGRAWFAPRAARWCACTAWCSSCWPASGTTRPTCCRVAADAVHAGIAAHSGVPAAAHTPDRGCARRCPRRARRGGGGRRRAPSRGPTNGAGDRLGRHLRRRRGGARGAARGRCGCARRHPAAPRGHRLAGRPALCATGRRASRRGTHPLERSQRHGLARAARTAPGARCATPRPPRHPTCRPVRPARATCHHAATAGRHCPRQWWERISRDAGLAADADWDRRLPDWAAARRADGHEREADAALALQDFVAELRARLGPPTHTDRWQHWARRAHDLLLHWLGGHRSLAHLPTVEHEAYQSLQAACSIGSGTSTTSPCRSPGRRSPTRSPPNSRAPPGGSGASAPVCTPARCRSPSGRSSTWWWCSARARVCCPGAPPSEAILTDADRALTDGGLALAADRAAEQRSDLWAVLAGTQRAVLTIPRGDLRATAVRYPSRVGCASSSAISRSPPAASHRSQEASPPPRSGHQRPPSPAHALPLHQQRHCARRPSARAPAHTPAARGGAVPGAGQ